MSEFILEQVGADVQKAINNALAAVTHKAQTLDAEQKRQARENIGAVSSSHMDEAIDGVYEAMATNYVSVSAQQNLSDAQKAQARKNIGAVATPKEQFKNVRFGFLGDSQTANNEHKDVVWKEYITDSICQGDGKYAVNDRSIGMFSIAYNTGNYGFYLKYLAERLSKAVDVVLVMGGINDVGFSTPLGAITDTVNTTYYGALKELCAYLVNKYPDKTIVFITPTAPKDGAFGRTLTGVTVEQAVAVMKEVCAMYSIPVYDAYAMSGICATNEKQAALYTTDGLHYNDAAQKRLGEQIAKFLQNNCTVEATGEYLPNIIGDANHAYYCDGCLSVDSGGAADKHGGVMLPGVVKMSVDLGSYTVPYKTSMQGIPGWFAFKQSDGSYIAVSPYGGAFASGEGLETLTGDYWEFDASANLVENTNRKNLWTAPTAKPGKIDVVLENDTAKIYFDSTEVYSTPCVELGYISWYMFVDLDGLTLTYAE